jgi:hypothetical protein
MKGDPILLDRHFKVRRLIAKKLHIYSVFVPIILWQREAYLNGVSSRTLTIDYVSNNYFPNNYVTNDCSHNAYLPDD